MENIRKQKNKGKLNGELRYNIVYKNKIINKKGSANYKARNK